MKPMKLKIGDVVQLNPEIKTNEMFGGCMLVVTEPKTFGCQGYVQALGENEKIGGQAYFRAKWEEMEFVGHAQWIAE